MEENQEQGSLLTQTPPEMHQNAFKNLILLQKVLILGIVVLIGVVSVIGGLVMYKNSFGKQVAPSPTFLISLSPTPIPIISPTCIPRPKCLDTEPRCMIPETENMCPPSVVTSPTPEQVACAMDALQCPDGSWVGRTGPDCEFKCPQ